MVAVAENTADELARSDGREVQLEEDPDLQLPFLLPEDGYSCDVVRNVPNGFQEFLEPLVQRGGQPRSNTATQSVQNVLSNVNLKRLRHPGCPLGLEHFLTCVVNTCKDVLFILYIQVVFCNKHFMCEKYLIFTSLPPSLSRSGRNVVGQSVLRWMANSVSLC